MIEAIGEVSGSTSAISLTSLESATTQPTQSFADLVTMKIESIDQTVQTANDSIKSYALGEKVPTHELMIQLETAKYELQLAIEVRNKVVEAYQELLRMQL